MPKSSKKKRQRRADYDGAWKEALHLYLEEFMEVLFSAVHRMVDWSAPIEFLDNELRTVARKAKLGKRHADVMAKVTLKSGRQQLLYLHVEIQSAADDEFGRRMIVYNFRLGEFLGEDVLSVAILADGRKDWRPDRFERELFGSRLVFEFPTAKLLDFNDRRDELRQRGGAAGLVILAQLDVLDCRRKPAELRRRTFELIKQLYEGGYSADEVRALFRLIEWMVSLPELEDAKLMADIEIFETEHAMPYITSFERRGLEKGLERGVEKGYRKAAVVMLKSRVGRLGAKELARIEELRESELEGLLASKVETLDELRAWLDEAVPA